MWRTALVCSVLVLGCGKSKSKGGGGTGSGGGGAGAGSPGGAAIGKARFDKIKQPPVSPLCAAARGRFGVFGYGAECVETELPHLETAAGKVFRLTRKDDPVNTWYYGLVRPDGTLEVGGGRSFMGNLVKGLDLKATAPEKLAQLYAELGLENAVVRCLPGSNDTLPAGKIWREHACTPPVLEDKDGKRILSFVVEQFEHPTIRDDHTVYAYHVEVRDGGDGKDKELSFLEGEGLIDLPEDGKLPPTAPPLPQMTTPPAWQGEPVAAPADVSAALCAAATETTSQLKGRQCKAYEYPSLELPSGSLYYLANDGGVRHALAFKKKDGTLVTGYPLDSDQNPMAELRKAPYDPAVLPPAKVVAVALFLNGESSSILCLPGSGDKLPDDECKAPYVEKKGEQQIVKAILLQRPFPDRNNFTDDPAVRTYSITFGPGDGDMSGGWRLVDMRDN